MIRHMNLLMALSSEHSAISFAAKKAEFLPMEGLCIYFPSAHHDRQEKLGYWLKRLNRDPIEWIKPSMDEWRIDIDGARDRLREEILKSYPYKGECIWPSWLTGESAGSSRIRARRRFPAAPLLLLDGTGGSKIKKPNTAKREIAVNSDK